ncbi:AGE family epimerase/isomerase [Microvirga rosea]|uniref:AGE family epimerase/isomerase n=1 Tax=Microvirga rosea TaxID=2715425 RepID=UPI001D0B17BB|nr:AGE family epimerase/isomerase [Microvirga rosea]MCB8821429.1 AGE family epimerase/isomerase [Microvirga rosea]
MQPVKPILPPSGSSWRERHLHRQWLEDQATDLFAFFQPRIINPSGGFYDLDETGEPIRQSHIRQLHSTTRMVHCFAIGHLLGRPGCADIIDHGMSYLWKHHRDARNGGYVWSLDDNGYKDDTKQAYGHAFVLLAASSAKIVGHPLANALFEDVRRILEDYFWEEKHGAVAEEFARDWSPLSSYRGQNSNMHLTEALMAAFEATGDGALLEWAERIASLIIRRHAADLDYRVAEHFDQDWHLNRDYHGSDVFRPSGTTPGHWLEWTRLLLQLWALGGKKNDWMPQAARALFRQSIALGWDSHHGGFFYTLDWNNEPDLRQKLWWPCAEAIGAASFLCDHLPDDFHEAWYRHLWDFTARHVIDTAHGGWHPELSETLVPQSRLFSGKPDLYHALQACLIPLFPSTGSLTRVISEAYRGSGQTAP